MRSKSLLHFQLGTSSEDHLFVFWKLNRDGYDFKLVGVRIKDLKLYILYELLLFKDLTYLQHFPTGHILSFFVL